jgi:hypothetical protein
MPGFNTLPAVGGGGGQANMTYVASVHMQTFNRSWAQGGTAGYYSLYSTNQENGYAYFVGAGTSTGAPLNRLVSVTHSFTRVDIIAPVNDMISLYKAKVKATTIFNNPFDLDATIGKPAIPSFPSVIRSSGNFVLPNNALPLINVLINGAGAHGGNHYCGGGGGGGSVVKLTAYQAVGTTSVTIGGAGGHGQSVGGRTYFGNVYALGGGGGGHHSSNNPGSATANGNSNQTANPEVGNGGGAGGHNGASHQNGGTGFTQTSSTGLGTTGSPTYNGGFTGGSCPGSDSQTLGGGGGAGAGGNGTNGSNSAPGNGGAGHSSDISGSTLWFGTGGAGGRSNNNNTSYGTMPSHNYGYGGRGASHSSDGTSGGDQGTVIVRYYIP